MAYEKGNGKTAVIALGLSLIHISFPANVAFLQKNVCF